MPKTYFLIHALDADSPDEAQAMLDGGYAIGADEVTIADDTVSPGDARLVGWPAWNDVSSTVEAAPGSLLQATITILGTPMHLRAMRVTEDGEPADVALDLHNELQHVYGIYDTALQTTDIDGYEGQFVLYATPHGV